MEIMEDGARKGATDASQNCCGCITDDRYE